MAACAVFSFASAQETGFGFGVKAGVNISNQTLDDAAKYKAGFTGGIFADYRTCNWFAVSVDVLYSRQGSKIENSDIKLRTDYLNIPVLANFYLTRGMALKTGGTYTFLTNDSGIGYDHIEPTIGSYDVEKLNDMMVRIVGEYLE